MSSPVHTALCARREGRVVEIDIGPTTATGIHFPVSPTFALALLHESAASDVFSAPGRLWRRKAEPPLARVITFDEMIQLSSAPPELKDGLVATFVASARYVATRNWTPTLWTRDADGYVEPKIPPSDPRARAAFRLLDDAWEAVCDAALAYEEKHAPHATLRIEVTEERWCAHLEPSMMWDVYAFDDAASLLL